jgi:hypothetical protein
MALHHRLSRLVVPVACSPYQQMREASLKKLIAIAALALLVPAATASAVPVIGEKEARRAVRNHLNDPRVFPSNPPGEYIVSPWQAPKWGPARIAAFSCTRTARNRLRCYVEFLDRDGDLWSAWPVRVVKLRRHDFKVTLLDYEDPICSCSGIGGNG